MNWQGLYKKGSGDRNMTPLLKTTGWWVWSGETKRFVRCLGSSTSTYGNRHWDNRNDSHNTRAFAVRSRSGG